MITKEKAMSLRIGYVLEHKTLKNADGTPKRGRVNGQIQTWKRGEQADHFRLPMKHGLRKHFYIDNYWACNNQDWYDPADGTEAP